MAITYGGLASTMVQAQMAGVSLKQDSGGAMSLMSTGDMKNKLIGQVAEMNIMSPGKKKGGLISGLLKTPSKKPGLPGISKGTLMGLAGAAVGQMAHKAGLSLGPEPMGGDQKGIFSLKV